MNVLQALPARPADYLAMHCPKKTIVRPVRSGSVMLARCAKVATVGY